jgi:putative hydrolase of the HAD superfamily
MPLTHVFFDIGGVLGTNGWDSEQRADAAEHFGLDDEFEQRHDEISGDWEVGALTTEQYLNIAVFYSDRPFTREEFFRYMCEQSQPFAQSIALARAVRDAGNVRLMTLNNESADLNAYRIERFRLRDIFSAFLSSCYMGARKPGPLIFERALGIAQVQPENVLFIDDRDQNLAPAASLGMKTLHYTQPNLLHEGLRAHGLL